MLVARLALPAALALTGLAPLAGAQLLGPTIFASIEDHAPFDGQGDVFKPSPFEGIVSKTSSVEARAVRELDLVSLTGATIQSATLTGTVQVNNANDTRLRTFDFVLYPADLTASLTDFQEPGVVVGTGSYAPPVDTSFDFTFDVASEVQSILGGGATAVGLRVVPTSSPNAPNNLTGVQLDVQATGGPPQTFWTKSTGQSQTSSPVVGDLDADGFDEIVLATTGNGGPPRLHAWGADGSDRPGFPVDLGSGVTYTPALADLDGDGKLEIILSANGRVTVYGHDGVEVPGWAGTFSASEIAVGDVDGDGLPEVVASRVGSNTVVYEHDGTYKSALFLAGFPGFSWKSGPTLADLDGDGDLEVIGRGAERYAAWHGDGTMLPGYPIDLAGSTTGRPVAADLDGDGDLELVLASDFAIPFGTGIDELHVLSVAGVLEPGWPRTVPMSIHDQASVEDLDGDGDLEIVMLGGTSDGQPLLTALHHDGTPVTGYPLVPQLPVPAIGRSAVVFADLDGDERPELIAQLGSAIIAYDGAGNPVAGYPLVLPASAVSSTSSPAPAAADLDRDGWLDLVQVASNDLVRVDSLNVRSSDDLAAWRQDDGGPAGRARYEPADLKVTPNALSVATGTGLDFQLDLGPAQAGRPYLLLPSASGTAPGVPLPSGPGLIALNVDGLSTWFLSALGQPGFTGFLGVLDPQGRASATLGFPGSAFAGLVGARIDFAAAAGPPFDLASSPVGVWIVP